MAAIKKLLGSCRFLWALLAAPSIPMILYLLTLSQGGTVDSATEGALGFSGTFAAFLLIITLALSPLLMLLPRNRAIRWLMRRRRYLGAASFCYAVVHGLFYFISVDSLGEVLGGFRSPSLLAGWLALFIFIPLAVTSNRAMMRVMGGKRWKMLQRGTYIAAMLVLVHWTLVEPEFGIGQILFGLLGVLESYRLWRILAKRRSGSKSPKLSGA